MDGILGVGRCEGWGGGGVEMTPWPRARFQVCSLVTLGKSFAHCWDNFSDSQNGIKAVPPSEVNCEKLKQ
jgi:hypothetical protein